LGLLHAEQRAARVAALRRGRWESGLNRVLDVLSPEEREAVLAIVEGATAREAAATGGKP